MKRVVIFTNSRNPSVFDREEEVVLVIVGAAVRDFAMRLHFSSNLIPFADYPPNAHVDSARDFRANPSQHGADALFGFQSGLGQIGWLPADPPCRVVGQAVNQTAALHVCFLRSS
jgi:hypothetical protein